MPQHAQRQTILQFACWPDRRGGGISSITHDLILSLNEQKRDVVLIYPARVLSHQESADAVYVTRISADEPFRWRRCTDRAVRFDSFAHLIEVDPAEIALSTVDVIHSHMDHIIPTSDSWTTFENSYRTLMRHISQFKDRRPKLVRTRHDDLQGGLDRLMRLTGVDFLELDSSDREALLTKEDLEPVVRDHVQQNTDKLLSQGITNDELENALDHVWFVISQLNAWGREQKDADAIVSLTEMGSNLLRDFYNSSKDNWFHIYNGTSMTKCDQARIDALLFSYHNDSGMKCFRGDAERTSRISFATSDQKIAFIGRQHRSKGLRDLVHAVRRLYHSRERKVRAIIVGDFSIEHRRELCQIDPEHAHEYLFFTGWIDNAETLSSILAFANVTAVPSHHDPFNLAACESLLMATPCVITESIGAGEAYLDHPEQHGVQVALPIRKPFASGIDRLYGVDIDSLANQLVRLLADESFAAKLGRTGQRFVLEHYDYRVMGKRYADLYDMILAD